MLSLLKFEEYQIKYLFEGFTGWCGIFKGPVTTQRLSQVIKLKVLVCLLVGWLIKIKVNKNEDKIHQIW